MAPYVMEYRVPLYVTVENGRISRVRVDDEADLGQGVLWSGDGTRHVVDKRIIADVESAIRESDWPAWEFGP